jgi:hypothetical protein
MLPPPQKKSGFAPEQQNAVMNEVRRQREPAQPMDVLNILEQSQGSREQAIKTYNGFADLVNKDKDFRVMRANNTLFAYNNNRDGSVDVAMETADNPRDLIDSIKQFTQAMKTAGFKTGRFEIDNPQIIKALKAAGIDASMQSSGTVGPDGRTPTMIGIVRV